MIEFDGAHRANCVFFTGEPSPKQILAELKLAPLPNGVVVISGGATMFPPESKDSMFALFENVVLPLAYSHDLLIVDGGTRTGVMKIVGEVFDRARMKQRKVLGKPKEDDEIETRYDPALMGFAPETKVKYPGKRSDASTLSSLDPNHTYFVLLLDAKNWGEEVEYMFSFLDHLAIEEHIPVINLVANGGRITIKETYHAVQQNRPVIILEGSHRATELIVAALEGKSESFLTKMLHDDLEIASDDREVRETLRWLRGIVRHRQMTRFEFLTHPHSELREIILSALDIQ
jgi:hypothetical protein